MALAIIGGHPDASSRRRAPSPRRCRGRPRATAHEHQLARLHRRHDAASARRVVPVVSAAMNKIGQERGWPPISRADLRRSGPLNGATSSAPRSRWSRRSSSSTSSSATTGFSCSSVSAVLRTDGNLRSRSSCSVAGRSRSARAAGGCGLGRIGADAERERQWAGSDASGDRSTRRRTRRRRTAGMACCPHRVCGGRRNDLTAADLESYGEAAWWRGKLEEAIAHRERAYAAYTAGNDTLGAARMRSRFVGLRGSRGVRRRGGLARERRAPPHGSTRGPGARAVALIHALTAMFAEGALERAVALFDQAYELATRVGDRDTQMLALSGKGRSFIKAGDIDKGPALLDEATASAMCGDLRAHSAGARVLHHDQLVPGRRRLPPRGRVTEAATAGATSSTSRIPWRVLDPPRGALRLRGDWPAAEAQAIAACEELKDFDQMISASGHYRSARFAAGGEISPEPKRRTESQRAGARAAARPRAPAAR